MKPNRIHIPDHFGFKDYDIYDFDRVIKLFDWDFENEKVIIDISDCFNANYQAMSILVLYVWHLKLNGCDIDIVMDKNGQGATKMWKRMGAVGWSQVLFNGHENFIANQYKPLMALRDSKDFNNALEKAGSYAKGFDIEYEKTLRYVISELLYNTLEHGTVFRSFKGGTHRIPSIIQFAWYQQRNELQFIIADIGIGIKAHLEQTYPGFENDMEAIRFSTKYQISGTFKNIDPYVRKDNAGVGLYISSNIVKKLHAEMHIISGNGLLHVTAVDTTSKNIKK